MVCAVRALFAACANLLRIALAPLWLVVRAVARPQGAWVELRLAPHLREIATPQPLWRRVLRRARPERVTSLEDVRELCRRIAQDPRRRGLCVHVPPLSAGWAACASVRQALGQLRAAGKSVVCYLPQGAASRELYVALAADRVFASPPSSIAPLGVASGPMYLKPLLDRIGIEVQVQAIGEYKSAAEPVLRESMSEPAREQLSALLATLHRALAEALAERTGFDAARVQAVFDRGLMTAEHACALGVVDAVVYEDELAARLEASAPSLVPAARYLRHARAVFWQPLRAAPYLAVVAVRGAIVTESAGFGRTTADLTSIVTSLREVAADPLARAVVLYVNSPGGSALASDLIHREVVRLAEHKPVVAYFSDVAASGGYYIAAPCARIVAQAVSITGSIGVISVKATIGGLLERLGVRAEVVRTSEHADMFSVARKLSGDEERMLAEHAQALYARFVAVVASGRKRTAQEIDAVARGRVWSGRDALAQGLVDVLGGFDCAVDQARSLVSGLRADARARLMPRVHAARGPMPPPAHTPAAAALLASLVPDEILSWPALLRHESVLFYAHSAVDIG